MTMQAFAEDEGVARMPPGGSKDALIAVQRANAAQIASTLLEEIQSALKAKQQVGVEAFSKALCHLSRSRVRTLSNDPHQSPSAYAAVSEAFAYCTDCVCGRRLGRQGSGGCTGGTRR